MNKKRAEWAELSMELQNLLLKLPIFTPFLQTTEPQVFPYQVLKTGKRENVAGRGVSWNFSSNQSCRKMINHQHCHPPVEVNLIALHVGGE